MYVCMYIGFKDKYISSKSYQSNLMIYSKLYLLFEPKRING